MTDQCIQNVRSDITCCKPRRLILLYSNHEIYSIISIFLSASKGKEKENHSSHRKTIAVTVKHLHLCVLFIPATMVDNYSSHSICSETL